MRKTTSGAAARIRQRTITRLAAGLFVAAAFALPSAGPATAATPLVLAAHGGHAAFYPGGGSHGGGRGHVNADGRFVRHGFDHRFRHHDRFDWGSCGPWDRLYSPSYPYNGCW